MSTMFDVPMHDFSGEGSMDTDMLPLSGSEVDWLQVENMIEDDVSKQLVAEEVEMIHETGVQEFEMVDTGDADIQEYIDTTSAEPAMTHSTLEVLDQEIPDASRATSPNPIAQPIDSHAPVDVSTIPEIDKELREVDQNLYTTDHYDEPGSVHGSIAYSEHVDHNAHDAQDEHILLPEFQTTVEYDHHEPLDPAQEHDIQHSEHTDGHEQESSVHTETVVIPLLPDRLHALTESSLPEESQSHSQDVSDNKEDQKDQEVVPISDASVSLEHVEQPHTLLVEAQTSVSLGEQEDYTTSGSHDVGEETKDVEEEPEEPEEEEEPSVEPPPCVLLTYLFDGSNYSLFQNPEKVQTAGLSHTTSKAPEIPASVPQSTSQTGSQHVQSDFHPTLLFAEQSDLFYGPISQLFHAIRSDPAVNIGGRFDENVELVITAVGLDLRLPEDNIHTREVSLNDLSVLHTGCELTGLLSLQLDAIAPRFGTRYKAIRDALVSMVSTTENHEHEQVPFIGGEEGQERQEEDTDAHQSTAQEEPTVPSSPSQKIHGQTYEQAINVKDSDTTDETKEVTNSRDSTKKAEESSDDEEAENDFETENKNENEGIGHAVIAEPYAADAESVQDEYYDEDAEGEYEEERQSYDGTSGDIETSYYSELHEENPPVEENDNGVEDQENDTIGSATEDHQGFPEGPIQDGLTPEQDSSGSAEGSLYGTLAHEEGADDNAVQNVDLPTIQNTISPRAPSSKRSFDEHENGQFEEDGGSPSSTGEATQKRLRLD